MRYVGKTHDPATGNTYTIQLDVDHPQTVPNQFYADALIDVAKQLAPAGHKVHNIDDEEDFKDTVLKIKHKHDLHHLQVLGISCGVLMFVFGLLLADALLR